MTSEIKAITFGGVNCYLVKTDTGYVLIDTGFSFRRGALKKKLENGGCQPGNLELIIITHGDFDHTGNCAYLREKYGANIAIHRIESEVVERGDMTLSRKSRQGLIARMILSFLGLVVFRRSKPDFYIEDGYDLSKYGFEAKVLHLPGHSKGSIGVLTGKGDLFCGDLLVNRDRPVKNSIVDDSADLNASVAKLEKLNIKTVYPGHGRPFPMELFINNYQK